MADFTSFNEFVDRTASAKVEYYRDTMAKALRRPAVAKAGFLVPAAADVSDDAIEAEFAKMKEYVLRMYKDVGDVKAQNTFLSPGGNFFDSIEFEQQPTYRAAKTAGYDLSTKPPAPVSLAGPAPGNPAFEPLVYSILPPLLRGLEDPFGNRLACSEGRVPLRRVTIAQMARLGKFENFFYKYPSAPPFAGTLDVTEIHHHAVCNEVSGGGHYFGCSTWLNVWQVDPSPGVFSLSQLWLIGSTTAGIQTIESGWQTYPTRYGTSAPVLFVYYNPNGYDNTGGYLSNADNYGFIQSPGTGWMIGDAMPPPYSVTNGEQPGNQMQWQIDGQGNWWLFLGTGNQAPIAVGFFPAGLYGNGTLARSAQTLQFGGEVCSQVPKVATYPSTGKMGSGVPPFPNRVDSFREVAFQKQIGVSLTFGSAMVPAKLEVVADPRDAGYSTTTGSDPAGWGTYMFFGGAHSNWPSSTVA
jgi:Neprosin